MTCINLLEMFGTKYRITWDEAAGNARSDPWLMQIPSREGITIYPHGGKTLAVEVDGHRNLVKLLRALPGLKLWQNGDREKTFVFDVALFPHVAEIVKPHRLPPPLTDEQREEVRQRLAKYAFRPVADRPKSAAG